MSEMGDDSCGGEVCELTVRSYEPTYEHDLGKLRELIVTEVSYRGTTVADDRLRDCLSGSGEASCASAGGRVGLRKSNVR